MKLTVLIHMSVGPIKFGMSKQEVRSVVSELNPNIEMEARGTRYEDTFNDLDISVCYRGVHPIDLAGSVVWLN